MRSARFAAEVREREQQEHERRVAEGNGGGAREVQAVAGRFLQAQNRCQEPQRVADAVRNALGEVETHGRRTKYRWPL